ncbi:hypothetical protein R3P38DRAFT_3207679 [Favolaschia claudopus]|uniref:Uncharacterized protein n=1 Tax=Favolaschia claudopus TaxID=2862362 RepID=A0AAW0AKF4_9AGAR
MPRGSTTACGGRLAFAAALRFNPNRFIILIAGIREDVGMLGLRAWSGVSAQARTGGLLPPPLPTRPSYHTVGCPPLSALAPDSANGGTLLSVTVTTAARQAIPSSYDNDVETRGERYAGTASLYIRPRIYTTGAEHTLDCLCRRRRRCGFPILRTAVYFSKRYTDLELGVLDVFVGSPSRTSLALSSPSISPGARAAVVRYAPRLRSSLQYIYIVDYGPSPDYLGRAAERLAVYMYVPTLDYDEDCDIGEPAMTTGWWITDFDNTSPPPLRFTRMA